MGDALGFAAAAAVIVAVIAVAKSWDEIGGQIH